MNLTVRWSLAGKVEDLLRREGIIENESPFYTPTIATLKYGLIFALGLILGWLI
jgi:hypothetical protein